MTATAFEDPEASSTAVDDVLSDDTYKREVELAFLERMVRHSEWKSAVQLSVARAHNQRGLETDVVHKLHDVRSPMWKRLARQLEKAHPLQPDFGEFGKFRDSDPERKL